MEDQSEDNLDEQVQDEGYNQLVTITSFSQFDKIPQQCSLVIDIQSEESTLDELQFVENMVDKSPYFFSIFIIESLYISNSILSKLNQYASHMFIMSDKFRVYNFQRYNQLNLINGMTNKQDQYLNKYIQITCSPSSLEFVDFDANLCQIDQIEQALQQNPQMHQFAFPLIKQKTQELMEMDRPTIEYSDTFIKSLYDFMFQLNSSAQLQEHFETQCAKHEMTMEDGFCRIAALGHHDTVFKLYKGMRRLLRPQLVIQLFCSLDNCLSYDEFHFQLFENPKLTSEGFVEILKMHCEHQWRELDFCLQDYCSQLNSEKLILVLNTIKGFKYAQVSVRHALVNLDRTVKVVPKNSDLLQFNGLLNLLQNNENKVELFQRFVELDDFLLEENFRIDFAEVAKTVFNVDQIQELARNLGKRAWLIGVLVEGELDYNGALKQNRVKVQRRVERAEQIGRVVRLLEMVNE